MQIQLAVKPRIDPQIGRARAHEADGGLGRLLHHIAQFSGDHDLSAPGQGERFHEKQLAADLSPGHAGGHADLIPLLDFGTAKTGRAEVFGHGGLGDTDRFVGFVLDHLTRYLAADRGNLAFQVAHPRLTRVARDHIRHGVVRKGDLLGGQAVELDLFGHQKRLGDIQLLEFGVAGQPDDLHAVLQRQGNVGQGVGRGDEHDIGKIVIQIQVVIVEGEVLLGVQHLQQRRTGIATEIHAHFVHFIQAENGVVDAHLLQRLDDLAGQSADVGAAMPANLGFIAYPAQGEAHEAPARSARDGARQRGFADARRSDQAKYRPANLFDQGLHRQIFQDALLGLIQSVMVLFQDALGLGDVDVHPAAFEPRQTDDPVNIVAHHRGLGGHGGHHLELFKLLVDLGGRFAGHPLAFDAFFQLLKLARGFILGSHLLANGAHLLVEVVVFLGLFHLLLDPTLDALVHSIYFDFQIDQLDEQAEAIFDGRGLQQTLLVFQFEGEMSRDGIGHRGGVRQGGHFGQQLLGNILVDLGVLFEAFLDRAHQCRGLDLRINHVGHRRQFRLEKLFGGNETADARARFAFDQGLDGAVRQAQQLEYRADHADPADILFSGIVDIRRPLGGQKNEFVRRCHGAGERRNRFGASYEQRRHHLRKDHNIPQGQKRQYLGRRFVAVVFE